ncbi:hypothetical protein JEQ12_019317 [Ovis aries]|uniref:Spindle and kinetochore-associated protein 3 n=1 Tax=Ovis aries TaxID=9940 RepID=A0A836CZ62_SHEEP|nr:hypothetical protein JEQ12_019317 [Ovis aries]
MARLQLALHREDSDFEDCPTRVLHDLHSEVQTLKDEVNIILDKASLQSQQSVGFIKATKILMKKNSVDIMKIKEFFQKYEYNLHAKKNSVVEQGVTDSKPESSSEDIMDHSDKLHASPKLFIPKCHYWKGHMNLTWSSVAVDDEDDLRVGDPLRTRHTQNANELSFSILSVDDTFPLKDGAGAGIQHSVMLTRLISLNHVDLNLWLPREKQRALRMVNNTFGSVVFLLRLIDLVLEFNAPLETHAGGSSTCAVGSL